MAAEKASKGADYVVTAPLVGVKDENDNARQLYEGDVVPDGTSQESIDWLLELGFVEKKK